MSSAVEEYLDQFDLVRRLAESLVGIADHLQHVSELLKSDPDKAAVAISAQWPTAEQVCAMVKEMTAAEELLPAYWNKLPERIRDAMPQKHPENAGNVGFTDDE